MVNTCESWIPPSPNLDKVTVSFDKLNNTNLFPTIQDLHKIYKLNKSQLDSLIYGNKTESCILIKCK